jgi:hypothetical protein
MRVVDLANHLAGLQLRQQVLYRTQNTMRRLGDKVSPIDAAVVAELGGMVHAEANRAVQCLIAFPAANDSKGEPQRA